MTRPVKQIKSDRYASPIGDIRILVDDDRLILLDFADNTARMDRLLEKRFGNFKLIETPGAAGISDRLESYFAGNWQAFDGIETDTGGTAFQRSVWKGLKAIPAGKAISYDQLAQQIGNPAAIRAAASANANNPISIVIPCHRVIGKNGEMRGYAGGIERKAWLLHHEGALI